MERRHFLAATGAVALAGCGSNNDPPDDTDPTDQTSTPSTPTSTQTGTPPSFEASLNLPESVSYGDEYTFSVEVENTGEQAGTWSSNLYGYVSPGPEPTESDWFEQEVSIGLEAGESDSIEFGPNDYPRPVVIYYRLGEEGAIQQVDYAESKAPIIELFNLVSDWSDYGDAEENRILQAQAGEPIDVSSRYWFWVQNQTVESFRQIKVFNGSGERVGFVSDRVEQITEANGWSSWESVNTLDTEGWGTGTYTAEILIRDDQNQEVSQTGTVEFELI